MGPGVLARFHELLRAGPIHLTLIDPEKSDAEQAAALARAAAGAGSHGVLLGGSTGISPERMSAAARAVRAAVSIPIVIFPEGPGSVAPGPDAIFFMSLLNSRNLEYVIRSQARASLAVKKLRLEPIPVGYLVVAPGMRVGQVGEVDPIRRDDIGAAQGYALAAEYLGMRLVYLEAGSGAPEPVPVEMVRAVREVLNIPLIVGGGIRSGEDASRLLSAGAQILVTGTIAEEEGIGGGFLEILAKVGSARAG